MNQYIVLINQLRVAKEILESRKRVIQSFVESKENDINSSKLRIADHEREKEKLNETYKLLINYKKYISEKRKEYLKEGATVLIFLIFLLIIFLLSIPSLLEGITFNSVLLSLLCNVVASSTVALVRYKNDTRESRRIYREEKMRLFPMPTRISMYDGLIHTEHEVLACNEETKKVFVTEMESLNMKIQQCESFINHILEKLPMISHICRGDQETINEVFAEDVDLEPALRLVRE